MRTAKSILLSPWEPYFLHAITAQTIEQFFFICGKMANSYFCDRYGWYHCYKKIKKKKQGYSTRIFILILRIDNIRIGILRIGCLDYINFWSCKNDYVNLKRAKETQKETIEKQKYLLSTISNIAKLSSRINYHVNDIFPVLWIWNVLNIHFSVIMCVRQFNAD